MMMVLAGQRQGSFLHSDPSANGSLRGWASCLDQDPAGLPPGRTYVAYNRGRELLHPIGPSLARRCRDGVLAEAMELWLDL